MLSRSSVVTDPGSQRGGLSAQVEAWAGGMLIWAETFSCLFFLWRVVYGGCWLTAIRMESFRQVWFG